MTIKLSDEDLEIISQWYHSAAGESASGLSVPLREHFKEEYLYFFDEQMEHAKKVKALLDRLDFEYDERDEYSMRENGLL